MGKDRQATEGGWPVLGSLDLAAALLLGGAGLGKAWAPDPAAAMLRRALPAGLRSLARPDLVRSAGLGEVAVAGTSVLVGGRWALGLLASAYLAFLALSARLAAAKSSASCGCFGRADSPVGAGHVVLNTVASASAIAGVVRPPGAWGGWFDGAALPGVV